MPIRQITIIGTGLIGGSLALALRKKRFRGKIIGCDQPDVLRRAKKIGAIDKGIGDPIKAAEGSDVVVIATPVGTIIKLIIVSTGVAITTTSLPSAAFIGSPIPLSIAPIFFARRRTSG